jgi:outer membrane murein-binding lipoprotein Lpp
MNAVEPIEMKNKFLLALALAASLAVAGCGSSSKANVTVTGTTTISKGQELTDLQRALDAGAISQRDYENVRAIILKRPS